MSAVTAGRPDLRVTLRRPGDALPRASIGGVPILWNNVDLADLRLGTDPATILDEIARTGYEGTQLGIGFPEGAELRDALAGRRLRLAEVYLSIPATVDGPTPDAPAVARERLRLAIDGAAEVLTVALDLTAERDGRAGRAAAAGTPVLTGAGLDALLAHIHDIAREAGAGGLLRTAFHPHGGTFIETPDEIRQLADRLDPALVGICLDVGHVIVGGGDPVAMLGELGERVTQVHLKDVDPDVVGRLRDGTLGGFSDAIRSRLFTELGSGVLDVDGVIAKLAERDYDGWLMVEQDSGWGPPSESAAIGRRVLAEALRRAGSPTTAKEERA
ncbi:MAG: sugar phosphate isomerase/epimerase [Chloroflexota bacterium]